MSAVLSNSLVVIAIVVSLSYAVWRLGPRKMRDAAARAIAHGTAECVRQSQRQLVGQRLRCVRRMPADDDEERTRASQRARSLLAQIDALSVRTSVPAEAAALPAAE